MTDKSFSKAAETLTADIAAHQEIISKPFNHGYTPDGDSISPIFARFFAERDIRMLQARRDALLELRN